MPADKSMPRTAVPDSTLAFLHDGYDFIGRRCRRLNSDVFRTRLLLEDVVCMTGAEAAELFYAGDRFSRRRAMPVSVLKLLQDRGSVQSLEDEPHRHRKALFLSLCSGAEVAQLTAQFTEAWQQRLEVWQGQPEIVFYKEVFGVLTEAACKWAGAPVDGKALSLRKAELFAMIDGAGAVGPRNWRALHLRRRSERWAGDQVRRARAEKFEAGEERPLHRLARHLEPDGTLLPDEVAAVELLNLLRPIAASANFIAFAVVRLHEHPQWREAFARGVEDDLENFAQEVRRLSPFFPLIGGRARRDIDWRGWRLPRGQWALLDLYGTCRDPRLWEAADQFLPQRFRGRQIDPFTLIPQGGGDASRGHRCPGEEIVIELMKQSLRMLARSMTYDVPPQDLSVKLSRMPALPKSGVVLANVRPRAQAKPSPVAARGPVTARR